MKWRSRLAGLPMILLVGCAVPYSNVVRDDGTAHYSIAPVRLLCERQSCRDPNVVVSEYFGDLAREAGKGCVVHVFSRLGDADWRHWERYVSAVGKALGRSEVVLYGYSPDASEHARIERRLRELARRYSRLTDVRLLPTRLVADPRVARPPYRKPYCVQGPVLEVIQGARLVSPSFTAASEREWGGDRAADVVVVSIKRIPAGR